VPTYAEGSKVLVRGQSNEYWPAIVQLSSTVNSTVLWLIPVGKKQNVYKLGEKNVVGVDTIIGNLPGITTIGKGHTIRFLFSEQTNTAITKMKQED